MNATNVWLHALGDVMGEGRLVAPRGKMTKELPQYTVLVDMKEPVLVVPERKFSFNYMAAEAFWILMGDDRLETLTPYNKTMAEYSDDGVTLSGAYGPPINNQLDYVVKKLVEDQDTRQAGLTIWKQNPKPSKDTPCTVAIWFQIRDGRLHTHVFMRSSDVWLGLPYDIFVFSMLSYQVCARVLKSASMLLLEPGTLHLTAASSHLYEKHWELAGRVLEAAGGHETRSQRPAPSVLYRDEYVLLQTLKELRESKPDDSLRWW